MTKRFTVSTTSRVEIQNITKEVQSAVKETGIDAGIAVIFSPHTTVGLLMNEDEPRLVSDILKEVQELVPLNKPYRHNEIDNNAAAHIASTLIGSQLFVPLEKGSMTLGTWQSILMLELDGPRQRQVLVSVLPNKL